MKAVSKAIINALSSYTAMGVSVVINLLLIPYFLSHLGKEVFGLVALVQSLQILVILAGSGLSQAMCRLLAICHAESDQKRFSAYHTNFLFLIGFIIAPLSILITVALAKYAVPILNVPPGFLQAAQTLMLLFGASSVINFVSVPYSAIFAATQRFYLLNVCMVIWQVLWAILVVGFLQKWPTLESYGAAMLLSRTIYLIITVFFAKRIVPYNKFAFRFANLKKIREVFSLSTQVLLPTISDSAYSQCNQMFINYFLGPVYNTYFSVCLVWKTLISQLLHAIGDVIAPQITTYQVRKEWGLIGESLIRSTKYGSIIGIPVSAVLIVLAEPILNIWLGKGYETSIKIMPWLMAALPFIAAQIAPSAIMVALGKYRLPGIIAPIIAAVNLIAVWICLGEYGMGLDVVVVIVFVCVFLRLGIIHPIYASLVCKVPFVKYLYHSYFKPVAAAIPSVCFLLITKRYLPFWNLDILVAVLLGFLLIYVPSCWFMSFDAWDRNVVESHVVMVRNRFLKKQTP